MTLRKSLWDKVSSRSHNPIKIFPFGSYADEVMLYGTVKYVLKEGGEKEIDWAARAKLVKEDDKVKMEYYQVYMVSQCMLGECECGLMLGIGYGCDDEMRREVERRNRHPIKPFSLI